MKKYLLIIAALLLMLISIGCSSQTSSDQGAKSSMETKSSTEVIPSGENIVLKFAHHWAPQSVSGRGFQYFADTVEEMSGGKMIVEVYAADSLVTGVEMYEAMLDKVVDIGYVTTSQISPKIRDLTMLEIPGFYDSANPNFDYFNYSAEIRPYVEKIYDEHGMVFLYEIDQGDMVICTSKPVKNADLKGRRIRDYGVWAGKALEKLGAAPMTIPPGDVTLSLERNVCDGAMGTWGFADGFKVYEQAPYVTWLGMGGVSAHVFMSKEGWNALSQKQQEILMESGRLASQKHSEYLAETEKTFVEISESAGAEHYHITSEEKAAMLEKFDLIFEECRSIMGPSGNALLDKHMKMR